MPEFQESLYDGWGQFFTVDELLYERTTKHFELIIFRNREFGRVLALDGVVQTTERDEFIYHEMLTHVPIIAHGSARRVLVVGGGDGGMVEEALKHRGLEQVVMVEVDRSVIDLCKKYLPTLSQGAFDDPRLKLVIADGSEYVSKTTQRFDVIIVDSPDPVGPAINLFSDKFYQDCRLCLKPGGVLVTQNGVPFVQAQELRESAKRLSNHFADVTFFRASVPTYYGGDMAFAWATENVTLRTLSIEQLRTRFYEENLNTRHYSPEIHLAAFATPPWIAEIVTDKQPRQYARL